MGSLAKRTSRGRPKCALPFILNTAAMVAVWVPSLAATMVSAQDDSSGDTEETKAEHETEVEQDAQAAARGRAVMQMDSWQDEAARSHFRVGSTLYQEGRFLDAASEFEKAHEMSGRAELLYNAYLAYRDAGRLDKAVEMLGGYLERAEQPRDEARLRRRLAAMRQTLEEEQQAQAQDEAERERLAEEAAEAQARADQEAKRAQAAESKTRIAPAAWAVSATGAALLVGAGVAALIARKGIDTLDENCPGNRCDPAFDLEGERDSTRRSVIATDALLFSGAATLVTGVVLLFTLRKPVVERSGTTASAACMARGCRAGLRMRF